MEAAVNVGDKGRLLYGHIENCNPAEFGIPETLGLPAGFDRPDCTQYKGAGLWKMSIYHTVPQLTGLDIRTLDCAVVAGLRRIFKRKSDQTAFRWRCEDGCQLENESRQAGGRCIAKCRPT